jgi:hypothetical protein
MVAEVPMNNGASGIGERSGVETRKEESVKDVKAEEWRAQDNVERIARPADRLRPWRVRCVDALFGYCIEVKSRVAIYE